MNSQDKKHYLQKYGELDDFINEKCDEITRWRDMATKITPVLSDMPHGSGGSDKIGTAVDNIISLETTLNGQIDKLCSMRIIIETAINEIDDVTLQRILYLAYIGKKGNDDKWHRLKLWEVANEICYSPDRVRHLHGNALYMLNLAHHSTT